jgi:hypothetical protein
MVPPLKTAKKIFNVSRKIRLTSPTQQFGLAPASGAHRSDLN